MKRVAHFIDSLDPGGAENLVLEICSRLPGFGYRTEVLHFGNSWIVENCLRLGLDHVIVPGHEDFKTARRLPRFAFRFRRLLLEREVRLLHAHLYGAVLGGWLGACLAGIPAVGTLHDRYSLEERRSRIGWLRLATSLGLRLVTVSRDLEEVLRGDLRFPSRGLRTIVNGIDVERFDGARAARTARVSRGDGPVVRLVSVGRLVPVKGYDVLLRALARLDPATPVELRIVGDGPDRSRLQELAVELGVEGRVRFLGMRSDIPEQLGRSDAFVLASRSEGLSCSIAEALAAGLPVVTTDVGGNAELVEDGGNGFLVPADDPQALARALSRVVDGPGLRRELGVRARATAEKRLSAGRMTAGYVELYRELVN